MGFNINNAFIDEYTRAIKKLKAGEVINVTKDELLTIIANSEETRFDRHLANVIGKGVVKEFIDENKIKHVVTNTKDKEKVCDDNTEEMVEQPKPKYKIKVQNGAANLYYDYKTNKKWWEFWK